MYDPDPEKVRKFCEVFPQAKPAASEEEILKDPEVKLVAGAAVTSERCALGLPEIRVKDRVAACNVKIWEMVIYLTEIQAVIKGIL